jgi:puromycin-sensitive aminopeptidase
MGTWVNQAGHPLVTAELSAPAELRLSQRRFFLDGGPGDEQRWVVPVTLRYATADGNVEHHQLLLDQPSTTVPLEGEPVWALVNENAWGVYRAHYSDDLRHRLYRSLSQLDDRERLGLVSDTWAATVAGLVALESSVELWSLLSDDHDPDVWWAVSGGLGLLDIVCAAEDRASLQSLVRNLSAELFDDVGWAPARHGAGGNNGGHAGEAPRQARLRARLVTLLGTLGADADVRAQARERLAASDAGRSNLAPDLATAVAQVVAAGGGDEEWEVLYSHYKKAATPQDEVRYLHSLAWFSQGHLLRRSTELAFSGEVRSQDAPYLVMGVLGRREGAALAWAAIEAHWDQMLDRWPSNTVHRMLEALPALAAEGPDAAGRAFDWLDTHPLPRGGRKVLQARERLGINLAFKDRVGPRLPSVLAEAPRPPSP